VGKTSLAVEYAYRHAGEYGVVWWLRAEEPATLAGDYGALALKLNPAAQEVRDQRVLVEWVREWLRLNSNWLLVFDNANAPDDLRDYIPSGGGGHTIITSRNPNWGSVGIKLNVKPLQRKKSIEFLCKRTGDPDSQAADDLAEALGDLPLALEQAGAFVEASGETLAGYLHLFLTKQKDLLRERPGRAKDEATVATTWDISFGRVETESPAGAALMDLLAFFAPESIAKEVIRAGAEYLPSPLKEAAADEFEFDKAVAALRRYSLIEVGRGRVSPPNNEAVAPSLSVHRLVQAVARERLNEDDSKRWAEAAVKVVNEAYPGDAILDDPSTWTLCARLLPHALIVTEAAEKNGVAPEVTGRLLNQTALYLKERAQYNEAKELYERALQIGEAAYGSDHPTVATMVSNLGLVLRDLGDLDGARAAFERALATFQKYLGEDHPNTRGVKSWLAAVEEEMNPHP
jgi:tetratricopeptide (TPR) repeat protein